MSFLLQLDDIQRIWTVVAGRFPDREALIARLGTELESVEQRRVAEAHRLLERATEKLMDIAHLTRGPVRSPVLEFVDFEGIDARG